MPLSSRQAAVLLDTHESSVKRWSNSGELACDTTLGGHRRIHLDALVEFALAGDLTLDVLLFDEDRPQAVDGLLSLRKGIISRELLDLVQKWLLEAQGYKVSALVRLARKFDVSLSFLYDKLLRVVMTEVGDSWALGAFRIGEEHRVSEAILDVLYSQQTGVERRIHPDAPVAVLGGLQSEEHAIGAMMVRVLLSEAGWKVAYLGRNVPAEDFLLFQRKTKASLICLSASVSRTPEEIIQAVNNVLELGQETDAFHVVVGGSGAGTASMKASGISCPERVHFFETATQFVSWADSFVLTNEVEIDETR